MSGIRLLDNRPNNALHQTPKATPIPASTFSYLNIVAGEAARAASQSSGVQGREGAMRLMRRLWLQHPSLHVSAAGNYDGPLVARARGGFGYEIVVKPEGQKGFCVLPRRWVVGRTFAWLGRWRRLGKDYEQKPQTKGSFIQIALTGQC